METKLLHNYGIQNEESDIRAHVGVIAKSVYVFQTKNWEMAVSSSHACLKSAYQPGVQGSTALGYAVSVEDIPGLKTFHLTSSLYEQMWQLCPADSDLYMRGKFAIFVVEHMLRSGDFPIWFDNVKESQDKEIQISGTDIKVDAQKRIQVKCDYKAGIGEGCTGNLFLQVAERNPLKIT